MRSVRFILALIALLSGQFAVSAQSLLVTYIEKAPYYYTDKSGIPQGFMIERVRKLMADSKIDFQLESRPPNRVLLEVRSEIRPSCSIGWFKTAEREAYARFTLPLYHDHPLVAVVQSERLGEFSKSSGVAEMLRLPGVRVGAVAGYSYGDGVDQMLNTLGGRIDRAPSPSSNLAKLIAGRFDFALFNTEELDYLLAQSPDLMKEVARIKLADVPSGKARHLMCSQRVDRAVIERLDQSIIHLRFDLAR